MDFISNLIKRPISLVLADTPTATDKSPSSSSLPNTESNTAVEPQQRSSTESHEPSHQTLKNSSATNQQPQQRPSLSLTSSFNGNFTDFIGVPDDLEEFDDFLPPPPPLLSASDLLGSPMDNNNLECATPSPPPPPLTPSMMASQTIDELLSEISDNLTLAGINDEVLAIASPPPPHQAEQSPLASKASLNNSQLHTPKTPTHINGGHNTAAGSAATSPAVFEANSNLHKFHVDPELATGLFDDQQHQHSANAENTSGVNKSSNKFVGLTEFDEAKIPELPGDLNPNIEVPTELAVEKTHLLLPNEVDNTSMSSANDTFSDCLDGIAEDKDPLANTFAEPPTVNTTADGDYYQSAIQDESNDAVIDLTLDDDQLDGDQTHVVEEFATTGDVQQPQCYEYEPMDVDMNATMDMIQDSAENVQNVEMALQHAENILQHLEERQLTANDIQEIEEEVKVIGFLAKQTESSKMTFVINAAANSPVDSGPSQHLEIEQSQHDVSLNKSIELPMNKAKTVSSECVITAVNNDDRPMEEKKQNQTLNRSIQLLPMNTTTTTSSGCVVTAVNNDIPHKKEEEIQISHESTELATTNTSAAINDITQKDEETECLKYMELPVNTATTASTQSVNNGISEKKEETQSLNKTIELNTITRSECDVNAAINDISKNGDKTPESLNKSIELVKNTNQTPPASSECDINAAINDIHQKEKSKTDEMPMKTSQAECSTTTDNIDMPLEMPEQLSPIEIENSKVVEECTHAVANENLTKTTMNTSMTSSTTPSCKIPNPKEESKLNLTTNLSTSTGSLKSSAPNLPSFPIKQPPPGSSFPKSPKKSSLENTNKPIFLEKSDYVRDLENKLNAQENGISTNNPMASFGEPLPVSSKNRLTFGIEPLNQPSQSDKRLTFNVAASDATDFVVEHVEDKRLTFNVQSSESLPQSETTNTNETKAKENIDSRRTYIVPSAEQQPSHMDTSFESMDVDDNISQNTTIAMTETLESNSPSIADTEQSPAPDTQGRPQSPALSNMQKTQSPALPIMQEKPSSQSPALAYMPSSTADSPTIPTRSNSPPPLPSIQNTSDVLPLRTMQKRSQSPPLPAMQQRTQSPALPGGEFQSREQSPPLRSSSQTPTVDIKPSKLPSGGGDTSQSPPLPAIQQRPPIHGFAADLLSAKEQSNTEIQDEKDVFVEKFTPSPMEDMFTAVSATSTTLTNSSGFSAFEHSSSASTSVSNNEERQVDDDEFQGNNNLILNPSDFDYLLTKGNNNTPVDRSSLLLKFDPLLGFPLPVNQGQQQQLHQQQLHLQIPTNINNNPCLSPTIEEDEHNESTNRSFVVDTARPPQAGVRAVTAASAAGSASASSAKLLKERQQQQQIKRQLPQPGNKKYATMSVDVIKDMSLDNNDCNKTFENSNSTQPDDKQINYKMDELEKKIKNEVLKTEDIEKKLKDAEQREEALIKRITEKDKTVAKMNGVIEAYEKAIAELIAEKEQLIQNYEKQLAEVKADRDSNYHHLTSLETTFSDLHVKYEKSKEMTCHLKSSEEGLITENRKNLENLRLQEQRYDKMKNHAMQQLEIANKKLECLTREHAMETTKLKALLKKEEIARSSISEQLAQKSKENAELVKICDELISGQGS